jgi:hypothetical protein
MALAAFAIALGSCDSTGSSGTQPDLRHRIDSTYGGVDVLLSYETDQGVTISGTGGWSCYIKGNPVPLPVGQVFIGGVELDFFPSLTDAGSLSAYHE